MIGEVMPTLNWFWDAFWPNVAATIVGVVIGGPIALYTNALAQRWAHARAKEDGTVRLRSALSVLVSAIEYNDTKLTILQLRLHQSSAVFELGVDTAAWEAIKEQVVENLSDPDLYRRLALHHSDLQSLSRLCVLYLDMVAGMASVFGGVEGTRESLRGFLLKRTKQLREQAASLKTELIVLTQGAKTI